MLQISYGNVNATTYASASICGFFIYENMSLSGRCHIVHFLYIVEEATGNSETTCKFAGKRSGWDHG